MTAPDTSLIDELRAASRQMVRELGFMDATLAPTGYPPSAVHTILEIGIRGPMTAMQIGDVLRLKKSSVSRMVRKLIESGELKETVDFDDARIKPLSLTAKGRRTLAVIHEFSQHQVASALAPLSKTEQRIVCDGLILYARALRAMRMTDNELQSVT